MECCLHEWRAKSAETVRNVEIPPALAEKLDEVVHMSRYGPSETQARSEDLVAYLHKKLAEQFSESVYHAAMTGRLSAAHMQRLRETVGQ